MPKWPRHRKVNVFLHNRLDYRADNLKGSEAVYELEKTISSLHERVDTLAFLENALHSGRQLPIFT